MDEARNAGYKEAEIRGVAMLAEVVGRVGSAESNTTTEPKFSPREGETTTATTVGSVDKARTARAVVGAGFLVGEAAEATTAVSVAAKGAVNAGGTDTGRAECANIREAAPEPAAISDTRVIGVG